MGDFQYSVPGPGADWEPTLLSPHVHLGPIKVRLKEQSEGRKLHNKKQEENMSSSRSPETEEQQRQRFQIELEFVQCLANPNYLNFLAQRGYFKDGTFVNYLKYLLYWKESKYAKYLKYPQSLHLLDLLQYEHFRKEIINTPCAKFIDDQQLLHWQHYHRKRAALIQQQSETAEQQRQVKVKKET